MSNHSRLVSMTVYNLGCVGPEGVTVDLDNILCLVGPNNAGKSTILRAYELAVTSGKLAEGERSSLCPDNDCPAVEISVHIPEGTQNIAERWVEVDGDLRLVKSRWEWWDDKKPIRKTYDPSTQEYAEDGKASGVDAVFNARLPKPLRVGALEAPEKEQDKLLALILEEIIESISAKATGDTDLRRAIERLVLEAESCLQEFKADVEFAASEVNKQFKQVFPDLSVGIKVGLPAMPLDVGAALKKGSSLEVAEGEEGKPWSRQGAGAQRALFWSLLGVRSRLEERRKKRSRVRKPEESADVALPGYMLLLDEPETGLHPNAIRAARKYLYDLAEDDGWQVMFTTHSPLFIDPTVDHTTIVRLEREGAIHSPRTYRSDRPCFDADEKEKLKMLLKFDSGLAEMFFGGFPVIVEGDTEFAAFERIMELRPEKYPLESRPVLVRARGKYTIVPIVKMLRHFRVGFSVLHDTDLPSLGGGGNSAWKANRAIAEQIRLAVEEEKLKVGYCQSVPNFEEEHGARLPTKDKPWNIVRVMDSDSNVTSSIESALDSLLLVDGDGSSLRPYEALIERVKEWADGKHPEIALMIGT